MAVDDELLRGRCEPSVARRLHLRLTASQRRVLQEKPCSRLSRGATVERGVCT